VHVICDHRSYTKPHSVGTAPESLYQGPRMTGLGDQDRLATAHDAWKKALPLYETLQHPGTK
jgi:hypothetical protein